MKKSLEKVNSQLLSKTKAERLQMKLTDRG